jgi:YD repeat-containing protein
MALPVAMNHPAGYCRGMHVAILETIKRPASSRASLRDRLAPLQTQSLRRSPALRRRARRTRPRFHGRHRVVASSLPKHRTPFGYEAGSNRVTTTTPRVFTTYFGYDALNRVKQVLDAVNGTTYIGYDIAGNTARVVDPLNHVTYFAYDLIDRLTSVTDALLNASYFGYDAAGNRNAEMDARANTTSYLYDVGNRLANVIDPLGKVAYYGYDLSSNLARTVDNNLTVIYFGYDALDRRTTITYPAENQSFGYDAAGNLLRTLDASGAAYFAYDRLSRLSTRTSPFADTVNYTYDAASNLTTLQYPDRGYGQEPYGQTPYGDPYGLACYYGYDNAQRMSQLLSPAANPAYYTYDSDSNVTKKQFGNGMISWATFDGADRVSSLRYVKSDNTPIVYFDYARDVAGRILTIGRENDLAIYYTYDNIDRLTRETWRKKSDNSQVYAFSYSYGATGNRLQMRRESTAGTETESAYYSYASDNSMTKKRVQIPPSSATDSYFYYDANGARTVWVEGTNATYYGYNAARLPSVIAPPASVEAPTYFYYDALMNRYCEIQAGTAAYFLWDAKYNLLDERNAEGSLRARYVHGYTPIRGIGSVLQVQRTAGGATYYQYPVMDHRGSVYAVLDDSQNTQLAYTMDSFGRQLAGIGGSVAALPNDLIEQTNVRMRQIGGKWYLIFRYRIVPVDEAVFASRDFLKYLNLYRLWSNNPVGQVDRDGLASSDEKDKDGKNPLPAGELIDDLPPLNPPVNANRVTRDFKIANPKKVRDDNEVWEIEYSTTPAKFSTNVQETTATQVWTCKGNNQNTVTYITKKTDKFEGGEFVATQDDTHGIFWQGKFDEVNQIPQANVLGAEGSWQFHSDSKWYGKENTEAQSGWGTKGTHQIIIKKDGKEVYNSGIITDEPTGLLTPPPSPIGQPKRPGPDTSTAGMVPIASVSHEGNGEYSKTGGKYKSTTTKSPPLTPYTREGR